MIGQTISHYRILNELGGGGMGVVYRAEDLLLGREVAVKCLPAQLVSQPDAIERFLREARLASSLNHPNICTIHDLGTSKEHGGQPFIVMELLEGATLKQVVGGRPLSLEQVLDFGIQIGEALAAAHSRGIIHRDIKPANVFVTRSGQVKILDFGLAKIVSEAREPSPPLSDSASTASQSLQELTTPGLQIGTMAYMSPEQARGEPVDLRTDLFSYGAVLYEMATGTRAFPGNNPALIHDAILNRMPTPVRQLNPAMPEDIERIVDKALDKERDLRYQDAADLVADLRRLRRSLDPEWSTGHLTPMPRRHPSAAPAPSGAHGFRHWSTRAWVLVTAALLLAVAGVYAILALREPAVRPLTDRDTILLGDIDNRTGEAVFDGTLRQALAVQIGQSPFFNLTPDDRIRETLRQMGRPLEEPLVGPIAREVCQRQTLKALLEGSLVRLGNLYVLTLEAVNCQTGESVAREQAESDSKERVLQAVGSVSRVIRSTLGESLSSIEQYDTPIEQATTSSLEALKAYTLALAQRAKGEEIESIPFFGRAIELDPNFALAHSMLSTVYGNLGESLQGREHARRAYALRERVSARERLFITLQYHDRVTEDQELAIETLTVWSESFPRDYVPANQLAVLLGRVGRFEQAVQHAEEAIRRNPSHPFPYSNLAHSLRALGRYDEARQAAGRAVAMGIETLPTRRLLYELALLEGRTEEAATHRAWARDRPREFDFVGADATIAAYDGRLGEARALYRRAIEMAEAQQLVETASGYRATALLLDVLVGEAVMGRAAARRLLQDDPTDVPRSRAATALGLTGNGAEAAAIVRSLEETAGESTLLRGVYLPEASAGIALGERHGTGAVEALRATLPYEWGFVARLLPTYLRGLGYLQSASGVEAAAQFQQVLDHRGIDPFSVLIPLSHLGLARAWALAKDEVRSEEAYDTFFRLWADADPDIPILVAARRERR